ncbi:MAG: response regulator [Acidobacteriota bacterium]
MSWVSAHAVTLDMGDKRILVTEDDKNTREALLAIFSEKGYAVTIAGDGEKALELLEETPFDLIISDLEMPGMNGLVFLRELGKRGIKTKVVVISAYRKSESYRAVEKEKVYSFIDKPFRKREILSVVERALMG